jgi:flagellar basal body-associated protein FliL
MQFLWRHNRRTQYAKVCKNSKKSFPVLLILLLLLLLLLLLAILIWFLQEEYVPHSTRNRNPISSTAQRRTQPERKWSSVSNFVKHKDYNFALQTNK